MRPLLACALLFLTGCASAPPQPAITPASNETATDTAPPSSFQSEPMEAFAQPEPGERTRDPDRLILRERDRGGQITTPSETRAFAASTVNLNFVDAPAADVVRTVVGEVLGETVSIANGVTARISLQSQGDVPAQTALTELERVLNASGLALSSGETGFLLAPVQQGRNNQNRQGLDYELEVVAIKNVRPTEVARSLASITPQTVRVTADDSRGVLLIEGSRTERDELRAALELFDTPYLGDRVFGLFRLRYGEVGAISSELQALLDAQYPGAQGAIELIELPRINQIFVITRTNTQFNRVRKWIDRLDEPPENDQRRLFYYTVQNVDADRLATQLMTALGGANQRTAARPDRTQSAVNGQAQNARPQPASATATGIIGMSIVTDQLNNALIIRASGTEYRDMVELIEKMDVPSPQVLIEATIAEVTLTDSLRFGVRWFLNTGDFSITSTDNEGGGTGPSFPGFSTVFSDPADADSPLANNPSAGAAIDALSSVTEVTVLSAPSVMVQNNETATLQVGDQVPIVTRQAQSTTDPDAPIVSTVQLQDTGVILSVSPRITAAGIVVIEVEQEVSDVAETVSSGIDSPTIQQRQFSSTVQVKDGGTVILGGLIRESNSNSETGVPGLRRLPLLGRAFSSETQNRRRTELLVFLTPRIMRDAEAADAYSSAVRDELSRVYRLLEIRSSYAPR